MRLHRVGVPYEYYEYDRELVLEAARGVFGRGWRNDVSEGARFWEVERIPTQALDAIGLKVAYVTQVGHTVSYDLEPVNPYDTRYSPLFD